jgi:hypothetical protein
MMRRLCVLAATLALIAPHSLGAQPRRVNVLILAFRDPIMLDTLAIRNDVPGSPGEVFSAARRVLDSLKLPVTFADSAHGLLFTQRFVTRSRVAGQRMSWALHCGTRMFGDNADEWRVTMAYAVFIDPSAAGTARLGITVVAGATTIQGASADPVMCGTTGALEADITKRVSLSVLKMKER